MAASTEEYEEILRDETAVDVEKLREWATHGIPQEVSLSVENDCIITFCFGKQTIRTHPRAHGVAGSHLSLLL